MKSIVNNQPGPINMTFGKSEDSGKTEHNGKETVIIIRHQAGNVIPAGNPKNKY